MKDKIKIGLDFHGVITSHPQYFSKFCSQAIEKGYEIHIITGGPQKVVEDYLHQNNIPYTTIFAVLDFYDAQGQVKYFENGEFKIPEELWDSAKAEYSQKQQINIHIDDSKQYAKWFTTPYCFYDAKAQKCITVENTEIDFSQTPDAVLQRIESIIKL